MKSAVGLSDNGGGSGRGSAKKLNLIEAEKPETFGLPHSIPLMNFLLRYSSGVVASPVFRTASLNIAAVQSNTIFVRERTTLRIPVITVLFRHRNTFP